MFEANEGKPYSDSDTSDEAVCDQGHESEEGYLALCGVGPRTVLVGIGQCQWLNWCGSQTVLKKFVRSVLAVAKIFQVLHFVNSLH